MPSLYAELAAAVRAGEPVGLATVIDGPGLGAKVLVRPGAPGSPGSSPTVLGTLGDADLDRVVVRDALGELAAGTSGVRHYGPHGEAREATVAVFVESFAPPPRMLVFGAVDFTRALVRVAKVLGYHVTVCDAREVFATRVRFPEADEVVVDWPDRLLRRVGPALTTRDAVCVLTHDAKFDVPALVAALDTGAGYIGAMGSRRTHAERLVRLREALAASGESGPGLREGDGDLSARLDRIRAPIGLDIGARTPEETAVSICAEVIADRTGRSVDVRPLRTTSGPIHRPTVAPAS
jgi:xanthine dehydrogenase accessory factor